MRANQDVAGKLSPNRVAPYHQHWRDKSKAQACHRYAYRLLRELRRNGTIRRLDDPSRWLDAIESLLVNLAFHGSMNRRLLVSRSTSHGSLLPRLLDGMERLKLIRQYKAPPSIERGVMTEVEQTDRLATRTDQISASEIRSELTEVVLLRDKHGNRLPVPETLVRSASPAIKRLNRILRGTVIEICDTHYPAPQYYRVYNHDTEHGGRWYCPTIQNQSKDDRASMRINGESVEEPDYNALHLRMTYHLEGMEWPAEIDPYTVPGVPRKLVKKLSMQLLNDSSISAAKHHLRRRVQRDLVQAYYQYIIDRAAWINTPPNDRGDRPQRPACLPAGFKPLEEELGFHVGAKRLDAAIDAFLDMHGGIAHTFDRPGQALRLQWLDARIAERVVAESVKQLRPVLPVHDSFITPARYADDLRDSMAAAYRAEMGFDCPIG